MNTFDVLERRFPIPMKFLKSILSILSSIMFPDRRKMWDYILNPSKYDKHKFNFKSFIQKKRK